MNSSGTGNNQESLSDTHWDVLFAILDAVVPAIVVNGSVTDPEVHNCLVISLDEFEQSYEALTRTVDKPPSRDTFRAYLANRASENHDFVKSVKTSISRLSPKARDQLGFMLGMLGSRFGALLSSSSLTPFVQQSACRREEILQSWHKSWFFIWPVLGKAFTLIAKVSWAQSDRMLEQICQYKTSWENPQVKPGHEFSFNFLQFSPASEAAIVETDVVIVGSGCGGAVSAKILAEAGPRVLVVDRGYYFKPSELPLSAENAHYMMQGGGGMTTVDGATVLVAGGVWGGGGSVNYGMSLPPSDLVRQEWANEGLKEFIEPSFQESLDRVCSFMGVSDAYIRHNRSNAILLEGSEKLGFETKVCPQNSGNAPHNCGCSCAFGCRESRKQGPAVSWLPAAAKSNAKFIEGFEVSNILFNEIENVKTAVGVEGLWTSRDASGNVISDEPRTQRRIQIKAKKVIVAGGALNTPVLLLKSGLTDPMIGKSLRITLVAASAPFSQTRCGDGRVREIGTSIVTEYENIDGQGHGVKVLGMAMFPFLTLSQVPWQNGLQFKIDALKFPHMVSYIAMVRDRDSGSVSVEPSDGSPLIHYTPSKFDRKNIVTGLVAVSKLCYLQGATELVLFAPGILPFKSQIAASERTLADPAFNEWLAQLQSTELSPTTSVFNTAHQMGSCRMSTSPQTGVVDKDGKVWGIDDLYIADSSVFPSASGTNPMITTMAIADRIANGIALDFK